jgi:hypothetical protein
MEASGVLKELFVSQEVIFRDIAKHVQGMPTSSHHVTDSCHKVRVISE